MLKEYLLSAFRYNEQANLILLEKIRQLPDKEQCIKFFSHRINSQRKWMARVTHDPAAPGMSWWEPVYMAEALGERRIQSVGQWIGFLTSKSDLEILQVIRFTGYDNGQWEAKLCDIALQLNYHSIHHRAQMQTIIRQQGLEPDFLDYINTIYRKID